MLQPITLFKTRVFNVGNRNMSLGLLLLPFLLSPSVIPPSPIIALPNPILGLILPSAYLLYIVIRRKFTKSPEKFIKKYNVVFDTYKKKYYYWEIIVLLRKVLIIIFTSFLSRGYAQVKILLSNLLLISQGVC